MTKFILGKKAGMTNVFDEDGLSIPVTVVSCGPCVVLANKTDEKDGYQATQIAYEPWGKGNQPHAGVFKKSNLEQMRYIREFRDTDEFEVGATINVADMFAVGDFVDVAGTSKGKGYAGGIKRHGYQRGRETHGSKFHRASGSLGSSATPAKVKKGKKLPGRMGHERVTVQNLEIVKVDRDRNFLLVKGAIPGPKGGLVEVTTTVKHHKEKKAKEA